MAFALLCWPEDRFVESLREVELVAGVNFFLSSVCSVMLEIFAVDPDVVEAFDEAK